MCTFFNQMSEFLYFSCVEVKVWCFSSFSKSFQKIENIEVFSHHVHFLLNSHMWTFFIQMSELLYFSWLEVKISYFSSFSKTFQKIKKNWSFCPSRTCRHFWLNSHMCTFFIQMSEFLYFSCPERCFSSFSKTLQKIEKNWSFRPAWTCRHFWLNSHLCTFFIQMIVFLYCTCPELKVWFFLSFSKTFQKIKKN